jgi:hypothetical protein
MFAGVVLSDGDGRVGDSALYMMSGLIGVRLRCPWAGSATVRIGRFIDGRGRAYLSSALFGTISREALPESEFLGT